MKVLAINCGSSTLKFQLIEAAREDVALGQEPRLASGIIDRIGSRSVINFTTEDKDVVREMTAVADHDEAARRVLSWLGSLELLGAGDLAAVGHRVVHGGYRFTEPTVINDEVIDGIESVSQLAPLHNGPSLHAIRAARDVLGPAVPQVAVFDTTFHGTIPQHASMYPIPIELAEKHHIQRYGFHGLAHRYMTERYAAITGIPLDRVKLITLQLGNGCSATAVRDGRSIDTSMGFTPLEGLMMGTRSGDLDPSLVGFLARRERISVEEVEDWLNTRSGLLGVSRRSRDMRELLKAAAKGDVSAALAIEMFCYRVRKYIGAYLAILGGAQAVIFGGGIGENTPTVRDRICAGMGWCGLIMDEKRNDIAIGIEKKVSADNAKIQIFVIPVDEEVIIARDTMHCLSHQHE